MTTTYYVGANDGDTLSRDPASAGTSSTAGSVVELRMGNGTYVPTQREVLNILEQFERWIEQNGLNGAGANLPPNRG